MNKRLSVLSPRPYKRSSAGRLKGNMNVRAVLIVAQKAGERQAFFEQSKGYRLNLDRYHSLLATLWILVAHLLPSAYNCAMERKTCQIGKKTQNISCIEDITEQNLGII